MVKIGQQQGVNADSHPQTSASTASKSSCWNARECVKMVSNNKGTLLKIAAAATILGAAVYFRDDLYSLFNAKILNPNQTQNDSTGSSDEAVNADNEGANVEPSTTPEATPAPSHTVVSTPAETGETATNEDPPFIVNENLFNQYFNKSTQEPKP
jgi:hypothetical protein